MMNVEFVSLIIPAYNAQKSIEKCLKSILDLNYEKSNFEVIVVDNNSTDHTASLVKDFPGVIYIKEERQGRSSARNKGASYAKGNLLAFIDSDVSLDKDWLKFLAVEFDNKSLGGAQGRIIPSNSDGQTSLNNFRIRSQDEATMNSNVILKLMYFESPMINSAACIYSKDAFLFVGGFDELLERHEDIDLSKRVSLAGYDLVVVEESLAHVDYHAEGWMSYFARSFQEGYTKQSYNKKWEQYYNLVGDRANKGDVSRAKPKYFIISKSFEIKIKIAFDEIVFNFIRGLVFFDSYFFKKSLNSFFRLMGFLKGILLNDYPGKFLECYNYEILERGIVINNSVEIPIEKNLRFVVLNKKVLYTVNIETNEMLSFTSFKSLQSILDHRVLLNRSYK